MPRIRCCLQAKAWVLLVSQGPRMLPAWRPPVLSLSENAPADGDGDRFAERLRTRGRLLPRPRRFLRVTEGRSGPWHNANTGLHVRRATVTSTLSGPGWA